MGPDDFTKSQKTPWRIHDGRTHAQQARWLGLPESFSVSRPQGTCIPRRAQIGTCKNIRNRLYPRGQRPPVMLERDVLELLSPGAVMSDIGDGRDARFLHSLPSFFAKAYGMRGIHLTQPAPTCGVFGRGRLPQDAVGTGATVLGRASLSRVFVRAAMAGRICLSALRRRPSLANPSPPVAVPLLPPPRVGDHRNHLSGYPHAADAVLASHLASHQPEEWDQRPGAATSSGPGQLSDGLGDAAQTASGNGSPRPGPAGWPRRGRRDLLGRWAV